MLENKHVCVCSAVSRKYQIFVEAALKYVDKNAGYKPLDRNKRENESLCFVSVSQIVEFVKAMGCLKYVHRSFIF
jgi:hypothetical protein